MIRFICREVNAGAAANIGGPVEVDHRTFTDAAALEAWLRMEDRPESWQRAYVSRSLVGCELVESTPISIPPGWRPARPDNVGGAS